MSGTIEESNVIHDWNVLGDTVSPPMRSVRYFDETFRDGIQCPSVTDPPVEAKAQMIRLLAKVGVHHTDIGLPGAGPRAVADSTILAEMIRDEKLPIEAACAARTHENDIAPIIAISQKVGIPIEVMAFLGASPIRLYAEGWDEDLLEKRTRNAVRMAKQAGLPCTFVTEDTTRSRPTTLRRLFTAAIEEGADGLAVCDTVGHATPNGVFNLIHFTKSLIRGLGTNTRIDWHGHNDRGLALENALWALEFGADRVHGTALGIGERVGNAAMELILLNLKLLGLLDHQDLTHLLEYCNTAAQAVAWDIPINYPLVGRDAFRTATGVHAAAIIKAQSKGDAWLADRIYSGVPAGMFGRKQEICVGYMSGASNVNFWLRQRRIEPSKELVDAILKRAKTSNHILTDEEILAVVDEMNAR